MDIKINNNILGFNVTPSSPESVKRGIAARARARRLEMNLTQQGMSARSGIPLATYRRFETSGEISISNLLLVAVVLGMISDFEKLFIEKRYQNIDDVINAGRIRARKRGKKND